MLGTAAARVRGLSRHGGIAESVHPSGRPCHGAGTDPDRSVAISSVTEFGLHLRQLPEVYDVQRPSL
jgi:hypothetical protein